MKNTPNVIYKLEDNGKIILKNVMLSYPHLFEPYAGTGDDGKPGKPKYSCRFLIPKATHLEDLKGLMALIKGMYNKEFKMQAPSDKICLKNGDSMGREDTAGRFVLSASESTRPVVYHPDGKTVMTIEDAEDRIYAGATVNVVFALWAQNNKWGKKINANLLAVQFVKATPRIAGRTRADTSGDFESLSDSFDSDFEDGIETDFDNTLGDMDDGL